VKLWHDDVRPPPDDGDRWIWTKTNHEAMLALASGGIEEASLDHDLGCVPADGMFAKGSSPSGTGLDLCRWMVEHDLVPRRITIHSWNMAGATVMAAVLERCCPDLHVVPYELPRL
jgi:hypothetical protein